MSSFMATFIISSLAASSSLTCSSTWNRTGTRFSRMCPARRSVELVYPQGGNPSQLCCVQGPGIARLAQLPLKTVEVGLATNPNLSQLFVDHLRFMSAAPIHESNLSGHGPAIGC